MESYRALSIFNSQLSTLKNAMNKYQVIVTFPTPDSQFMAKIPAHRAYINKLIYDEVIEYYAISAERTSGWIVMNANSKREVIDILEKSPLFSYFELDIDQLMVFDSTAYRFPKMVLN